MSKNQLFLPMSASVNFSIKQISMLKFLGGFEL